MTPPRRRLFQFCLSTWLVAMIIGGVFWFIYRYDKTIFDEPSSYGSPYSGRPQITFILIFCLFSMGGGAILTWLVTRPKQNP